MAELKVRNLQTKDVFTVARIIQASTSSARDVLAKIVAVGDGANGETVNVQMQDYALALFESVIDQETEIKKLVADLGGISVKDYETSDFETTLDILEELSERHDLNRFLERAKALQKKISGGSST